MGPHEAGRSRKEPPLEPTEAVWPCRHLASDFWPPRAEKEDIAFQATRVGSFSAAKPGDQTSSHAVKKVNRLPGWGERPSSCRGQER